jgi:DNA-binding transcriptional ArsR family regulator
MVESVYDYISFAATADMVADVEESTQVLERYIISDIRQLKAISHSSRVKILQCLADKPMTAKQLADSFGEEPAKTSYHVKQLLKAGLVELVHTRETQNGIIEKYYRSIAKDFQTDPYLARRPEGRSQVESRFLRDLNQVQSDFLRAYRGDGERDGSISTTHGMEQIALTTEQLPAFVEELEALLGRYRAGDETGYTFHFLLFPSAGSKAKAMA